MALPATVRPVGPPLDASADCLRISPKAAFCVFCSPLCEQNVHNATNAQLWVVWAQPLTTRAPRGHGGGHGNRSRVPIDQRLAPRLVSEAVALCNPDAVHWCDGSAEEYDRLCGLPVETGTFEHLSAAKRPNSYLARSI
jgi:hypothetical protein